MRNTLLRRRAQHDLFIAEVDTILTGGDRLHLINVAIITPVFAPAVRRVDEAQFVVIVDHRTARKTAVAILLNAGCQCNGQVLPGT